MNHLPTLKVEEGGRFVVAGELGFGTVTALHAAARDAFAGLAQVEVDLAGVTKCDSAAVALLLEWTRLARRAGATIRFHAIPEPLLAIAHLSEVEALLPQA